MTPDQVTLILYRLDKQDQQLDQIEQHVIETNGRVKRLELWRAGIDGGRKALAWLPTIALSVASGVLVYILTH